MGRLLPFLRPRRNAQALVLMGRKFVGWHKIAPEMQGCASLHGGRILRLLDMRDAGAISGAPLTAPYRHNRIFQTSDAAVNPMGPRPVVTTFVFPLMARRAGIWRHQTPALGVATCAANCWTESSFCRCRSSYVPTLNRVMPIATVAGLCDSSITPPQLSSTVTHEECKQALECQGWKPRRTGTRNAPPRDCPRAIGEPPRVFQTTCRRGFLVPLAGGSPAT